MRSLITQVLLEQITQEKFAIGLISAIVTMVTAAQDETPAEEKEATLIVRGLMSE